MLQDTYKRPLRNLRLSVTDRCNLRCGYCMPEKDYLWLPKKDVLTFEEMGRLVDVFSDLGVDRVRITGGEPLLRRDLATLVKGIADSGAISDIALTTNGVFLAEQAGTLAGAGLHRITLSLDTLRPDRFAELTRRQNLDDVLAGVDAATTHFDNVKIDSVVMKGVNDDEISDLLNFSLERGIELRFIEYMDVGGATRWSMDQVVTRREILNAVAAEMGEPSPVEEQTSAPADRFRLPDGGVFGIISSTTQPFCGACDRSRLTADGRWLTCLYATDGLDLKTLVRNGAGDDELRQVITQAWNSRSDRGAEDRLAEKGRGVLADRDALRANPHLEMHTRGG